MSTARKYSWGATASQKVEDFIRSHVTAFEFYEGVPKILVPNNSKKLYHKISTVLTNKFDMIVVADLKIKNLSKSSKGNKINHGKMIKQKSGLNRTILNASFYQFLAMLEYK